MLPGVIDGHVHIADPDLPHREDFISGTAAAVSNGTTMLIEHHHSLPVKNAAALREKAVLMQGRSHIDFGFLAHAHPDNLNDLAGLWEAGIYGFKIFTCALHGAPAVLSEVMLDLFQRVAAFDGYCLVHCEDDRLTAANEIRLKAAGRRDGASISEWRSLEAELLAVSTTTLLARLTGARITVAHVSHPAALDIIARERAAGGNILAESCPHYFYLTADDVAARGPWAQVHPSRPQRRGRRRDVAPPGGRRGGPDLGRPCTRHAGREAARRSGYLGLPLRHSRRGNDPPADAQRRRRRARGSAHHRPAPCRRHRPSCTGSIRARAAWPWARTRTSSSPTCRHRGRSITRTSGTRVGWTPYDGRTIRGTPHFTIARGRVLFEEGQVVGETSWGRYLPRPGSAADRA